MLYTFTYWYLVILGTILIKEYVWKIFGIFMAMKAIDVKNEFLLYDLPVNPDIITACIILEDSQDRKKNEDKE